MRLGRNISLGALEDMSSNNIKKYKIMTLTKSTHNFEYAELLSFGDIEIHYDDNKAVLYFEDDIYDFPRELVNDNLDISFNESDNDYQDFSYITINNIDYLYNYDDNSNIVLTPIKVYSEGEYYFYKEI